MLFRSNDTATTEIYTFSLHDALPIWGGGGYRVRPASMMPRSAACCSRKRKSIDCAFSELRACGDGLELCAVTGVGGGERAYHVCGGSCVGCRGDVLEVDDRKVGGGKLVMSGGLGSAERCSGRRCHRSTTTRTLSTTMSLGPPQQRALTCRRRVSPEEAPQLPPHNHGRRRKAQTLRAQSLRKSASGLSRIRSLIRELEGSLQVALEGMVPDDLLNQKKRVDAVKCCTLV